MILILWRIECAGEAICGSPTPLDYAICAKWANHTNHILVTAADTKINIWQVDADNRKLHPESCDVGKRKRVNQCVVRSRSSQTHLQTLQQSIN
jgi:hypothetical protein